MADLGKIENLFLPYSGGRLEILWKHQPRPTRRFAVICHPHPLHGGTMHNKVVFQAAKAFFEGRFDVVRFNFRGVGASTGAFGEGEGEQEDLRTVLREIKQREPKAQIALCGYSFGAYVSARVAVPSPPDALVLIAPPSKHYAFDFLEQVKSVTAVVFGDQDEFVEDEARADINHQLRLPHLVLTLPTNHFFESHLEHLRELLSKTVVPFISFCLAK
ncbi:MAG TPA: alpha/beta fold hydrolase [Acidobacteriota bacterium]|jgi:hypothetical protein